MKKIFLILTLCLSISVIACSNSNSQSEEKIEQEQNILKVVNEDITKLEKLIEHQNGNILDVRTPEEWAEGIIDGALKINFYDDSFKTEVAKLDKNKTIYVYCKSGGRSANAADQILEMGFKKVINLEGGIKAWNKAGKQTVK